MLILLSALLSTLGSMFRSRAALELEHIALRHQIGVLKRSARKRPKLTPADRLFWVFLSRVWCDWRSALDIIKPLPGCRKRKMVDAGCCRRALLT
jgi:putative transposase